MTPVDIIIYSSITFAFYVVGFLIIYYFRTKRLLKANENHIPDLLNELKPGMQVVCAGGLIGIYEGHNKENTIADIRLNSGDTVQVAFYTITNILSKKASKSK